MRQPELQRGAVSGRKNIFRAAHLTHATTRDGVAYYCVVVCVLVESMSSLIMAVLQVVGWCDALMFCFLICLLMYATPVFFVSSSYCSSSKSPIHWLSLPLLSFTLYPSATPTHPLLIFIFVLSSSSPAFQLSSPPLFLFLPPLCSVLLCL